MHDFGQNLRAHCGRCKRSPGYIIWVHSFVLINVLKITVIPDCFETRTIQSFELLQKAKEIPNKNYFEFCKWPCFFSGMQRYDNYRRWREKSGPLCAHVRNALRLYGTRNISTVATMRLPLQLHPSRAPGGTRRHPSTCGPSEQSAPPRPLRGGPRSLGVAWNVETVKFHKLIPKLHGEISELSRYLWPNYSLFYSKKVKLPNGLFPLEINGVKQWGSYLTGSDISWEIPELIRHFTIPMFHTAPVEGHPSTRLYPKHSIVTRILFGRQGTKWLGTFWFEPVSKLQKCWLLKLNWFSQGSNF